MRRLSVGFCSAMNPPAMLVDCRKNGEPITPTGGVRFTRFSRLRALRDTVRLKRCSVNPPPKPPRPPPKPPKPPPPPRPPPPRPPPPGPSPAPARDPPTEPANFVLPKPHVLLRRIFTVNCAGPVPR